MVDIIRTRRSSTPSSAPTALNYGQLAVNIPDKKIWIGDTSNLPVLIFDNGWIGVSTNAGNKLINGTDLRAYWDGDYGDLINAPTTMPPTDHTHAGTGTGGVIPHANLSGRTAASSHPATAVSYDNTLSGISATEVQAALDEIAVGQAIGVFEFGAVATHVGSNEIFQDVNVMDWTAHPQAIGTALNVPVNALVTFGNSTGVAYRYVGPKPVLLGLGGDYVTVAADFIATGTADHNVLINRNLASQHAATAVDYDKTGTDIVATTVQGAITEHVNDKTGNPHNVAWSELSGSQPPPIGHDHDGGVY